MASQQAGMPAAVLKNEPCKTYVVCLGTLSVYDLQADSAALYSSGFNSFGELEQGRVV